MADVCVLIIYPNLNVVVKHDFTKLTKSLLKAIACNRWKTAANIILKHDSIIAQIQDLLRRKINNEFQQLSSDCLLKGNSPKETTAFANDAFVNELRVKSPLWFSIVSAAFGMLGKSQDKKRRRWFNVISVATSVLAKFRNAKLSALAYRISMVLLHGGFSYLDVLRLNRLGICMSPDFSIELQRKMGLLKFSLEEISRR